MLNPCQTSKGTYNKICSFLQLAGELQFFATETLWLLIFRPKRSGWDTQKMLFQLAPHAITVASGTSCTARALRLNGSKQPCPHDRMSLLIVVEHRRKENTETQILAVRHPKKHWGSTRFIPCWWKHVKTLGFGGPNPQSCWSSYFYSHK